MDINNFWSPSGGGVRSYHLQKMEYYQKKQNSWKLIFLMQDSYNETEEISPTLTIEHVKAFKVPGKWWKYRFIRNSKQIKHYIEKHRAEVVEVGSPYTLPARVRNACKSLKKKPVLAGFWHADFPVTYIRRVFEKINSFLAKRLESLAWTYARGQFKNYKGIQVSCKAAMERMSAHGMANLHWLPLGVDSEQFNPSKKDEFLIAELKAGEPRRLTMFFPHRFCEEKGLSLLLNAYPIICEKLGLEPALVFAGTGNKIRLVEKFEKKYKHIKYVHFIKSTNKMAKYTASCEIGFALSSWETFGLSILEGMASGQCIIAANAGAAAEHIGESGGGVILKKMTPEFLADAVCEIANNKEKIQAMGACGRAYAEKFSWDACFKNQQKFYEQLIE
jgi:alpha-1,6-mannosyltransferase